MVDNGQETRIDLLGVLLCLVLLLWKFVTMALSCWQSFVSLSDEMNVVVLLL